ncbi:hypothetical protein [Bradyrhizobium sp.]|jgi:hypothetical protein|uniref:hypothetical protein n=1 Tax=Bradyrhizobium sp. TaxID=376 RepID=UPI002DFC5987|nr:hypothetical protein [Bradyrhizobium sp.]
MLVPDEFTHLVHRFYQGSEAGISTMEQWVALAVRGLNQQQQAVIKRFLRDLLARNPSDAELRRIWEDTGPNYDFEDIRGVLTLIRDAIPSP